MYPVLHPDDCWFGNLNDKQYFFFFLLFVITILLPPFGKELEAGEEYLLPSLICAIMFLFL